MSIDKAVDYVYAYDAGVYEPRAEFGEEVKKDNWPP
jgi:hypothetical protein